MIHVVRYFFVKLKVAFIIIFFKVENYFYLCDRCNKNNNLADGKKEIVSFIHIQDYFF